MSVSPYEIAIKLSMQSNVAGVFALLSKGALGLEGDVARLSKTLGSVNTASALAAAGLAGVASYAVISGFKTLVDHAKDLSHELVQVQKLGESSAQFAQAKAAAFKLHGQVPGATSTDALKLYGATYSMFGHEGALKVMKPLAEFAQVMGNTSGDYKKAFDNLYDMVRGGELMGKFLNESTHLVDTDKLTHFLELGSKVVQATHGKVSAQTWFGMAQQGGPALSMLDDNGMLTMAMVSQAMGGQRAGTALSSMFQQMAGGKMSQYAAQLLSEKYHLVGGYTVGRGGHLVWDKGALDPETHPFIKAMGKDPLEAVKMLKDKMGEGGLNDMEHIIPELYQMLGRNTTQRLVHDLMRNLPQLMGERERMKGGLGTAESLSAQDKDYTYIEHKYDTAKEEMLMHIGLPMMQTAIPILQQITKFFDSIGEFAKSNPQAMQNIGNGILVLGGSLAAASGLALLAAIGPAGWFVLGVGALGAAFVAFPDKWTEITNGLDQLKDGLQQFLDWLKKSVDYWTMGAASALFGGNGGDAGAHEPAASVFNRMRHGPVHGLTDTPGIHLSDTGGMKPYFKGPLEKMIADAHAQGHDLHIVSGYRSHAHQAALFARSNGSGHWVARPGHSRHEMGIAADLGGDLGWAHAHAHDYGLHFPMSYEKWHVEPEGSRHGHARHAPGFIKPKQQTSIENVIVLDGKVIARNTSQHIASAATHPTTAPYHDGSRHWTPPDAGLINV